MIIWELDIVEERERVMDETEDPQLILSTIQEDLPHWQDWGREGFSGSW
jgi:hypothetical protein